MVKLKEKKYMDVGDSVYVVGDIIRAYCDLKYFKDWQCQQRSATVARMVYLEVPNFPETPTAVLRVPQQIQQYP